MSRKLLAVLVTFIFLLSTHAQTQSPVYLSQPTASGTVKGYYEYLPGDYSSSTKNYPLIIWIHGSGQGGEGNATDLPKILEWGVPRIISEGTFPASFTVDGTNFSFIVISPQFTTGWPNGTMVNGMINYVVNKYRVDPDRIYLMGMSAGGGAVWDYASMSTANSNRLGAIIPFCGAFAPTQAKANIIAAGKLPVWAFHNTNDGTVPVQQSRNWVNYINAYVPAVNPAAQLTEFPVVSNNAVVAHDSWSNVVVPTYKPNGINVYEWLLQYKRRVVTANGIPQANAGTDQGIVLPADLLLDGSGSTDPDGVIVSYKWRKVSGPSAYSFVDSTVMKPTVQNLAAGVYQFALTVTDNMGASATDNVTVNVYPAIPPGAQQRILVDIGADASKGGIVTTSPNINGNTWNNMTNALPGVRLSNAVTTSNMVTPVSLEVINRLDGTYSPGQPGIGNGNNAVTIGDYPGSATTDHALVHSSATNGRWRIFGLDATKVYVIKFWGARTNTTASRSIEIKRSDDNIWLTYNATGNTNYNNAAVFNISGKTEMSFDIRTKAGSEFSCINVLDISFGGENTTGTPTPPSSNNPPVANAGNDITINLPVDSATLNGCASYDPEDAALSYQWTKVSGPGATILSPALCATQINNLAAGTYIFELAVRDTGNVIIKDSVKVTVNDFMATPWPPPATPVCSQAYKIVVVGSSSAYGTGATPIDSSWVNKFRMYVQQQNPQITVTNIATLGLTSYQVLPTGFVPPANRPVPETDRNITKALSLNPDAIIINLPSNDIAMGYSLQECYDNFNRLAAAADAQHVPVWITTTQPRDRLSPTEKNMQMTLRDWIIQRFGNKSVDFWTTIGNSDGSMVPLYSAGDSVHQNNYGHHIFFTRIVAEKIWDTICNRLTGTPPANQAPVARAGADQSIQLPANKVFLDGRTSTDADGNITAYQWTIVSGPAGSQIITPAKDTTSVSFANAGTYICRLTVTDNGGLMATDEVTVTIRPLNQPPVARAGADQTIQLPANKVFLDGRSSTDADGTITTYQWSNLSGPAGSQILTALKDTTSVSFTTAGTYTFRLAVTDNGGTGATDDVIITVQAAATTPPPPSSGAGKTIRVNVYGGSNPYTNTAWNNWNSIAGTTSSNFFYEDGSASTVNGVINSQAGIADNGLNYAAAATACPGQVLRYNSYNTSIRTLTLKGLDPAKRYYMEFYGSRANTGNSTVVNIANAYDTISTDNNTNDFAKFGNVAAQSNGSLVINLSRIGTYNYIAGFIIREEAIAGRGITIPEQQVINQPLAADVTTAGPEKGMLVYPNPFTDKINIRMEKEMEGPYRLRLTNIYGKTMLTTNISNITGKAYSVNAFNLASGVYFLTIQSKDFTSTVKVIKE
jgi:poly(3-hydroxybutyrate) depolymerase